MSARALLTLEQRELLASTVTAARAIELLEVLGLRIGLRELAEARRTGRLPHIRIGDGPPRFDPVELEKFAQAERAWRDRVSPGNRKEQS